MRKCTKCGREKEDAEFYARSDRPAGLQSRCKVCICADMYAAYDSEKSYAYKQAAKKRLGGWATAATPYWARTRKLYGFTPEELSAVRKELIIKQGFRCAIPNCPRNFNGGKVANLDHHGPSGKLRGMLCWTHNRWLSNMNQSDLQQLLAYLNDPPAPRLVPRLVL